MSRDSALISHQHTSSNKTNASPSHPFAGEKHNRSGKTLAHTIAHAKKIATTIFRKPISKSDWCIDLTRLPLTHDATSTAMCASILPHLCRQYPAAPCRRVSSLKTVDTTPHHQPAAAQKNDALKSMVFEVCNMPLLGPSLALLSEFSSPVIAKELTVGVREVVLGAMCYVD
jgi:hypothetical protein